MGYDPVPITFDTSRRFTSRRVPRPHPPASSVLALSLRPHPPVRAVPWPGATKTPSVPTRQDWASPLMANISGGPRRWPQGMPCPYRTHRPESAFPPAPLGCLPTPALSHSFLSHGVEAPAQLHRWAEACGQGYKQQSPHVCRGRDVSSETTLLREAAVSGNVGIILRNWNHDPPDILTSEFVVEK